VNVAARLETLARPGGVAISGTVRDHIGNKLNLTFQDMGERALKNIERPVRIFHLAADAAIETYATALASLPIPSGRPSIAVLPFANISGDPEQEYFADGITEDIITDLANVSGLFVLSRNTVFAYKRRVRNVEHVARELGVAYVVEGSVRKVGNRLRINAELTEGASDGHLWAARYDRNLTDIFELQDEITKTIVEQLKVKLLPEEKRAIEQSPTASVEAYSHFLRGREYYHIASKANHLMARQSFVRAIELDPNYARAYAGIAVCDIRLQSIYGSTIKVEDILKTANRAIEIDPELPEAHAARGFALSLDNSKEAAMAAFERALEIDPNCHEANRYYAEFCVTQSRFEDAARLFIRALEVKPTDYGSPLMLIPVFRSLGDEEKALTYARIGVRKAEDELRSHPENANCACLGATALAFLGESQRAIEWLERSLATDPGDLNIQYNAACTYALLGEAERAIITLEGWVPQVGPEMRAWFRNDSDLTSIRDHPRYLQLIASLA
jgi:adenylate cyclase